MISNTKRKEILKRATKFYEEIIIPNHLANLSKLKSLSEFNPNPFLSEYLAVFLTGNDSSESIAKALIYPRILGTSITTSFGQNFQTFISTALEAYGSTTPGIDIEYIDQVDSRKKYCQVKAGPLTINKDDVTTIRDHFRGLIGLARVNNLKMDVSDMTVGVLYGNQENLSPFYLKISELYPVVVGQEFWYRLTGDKKFYDKLIDACATAAKEANASELVRSTIKELAKDIENCGGI